jgi:hypothetical protein
VRSFSDFLLGLVIAFLSPVVAAQSNLGELLDAGAKRLSVQQFRVEVVQQIMVGPTASGGTLELMYAPNGAIQGTGTAPVLQMAMATTTSINGEWTVDDQDRICTSIRVITTGGASASPTVVLPPRCQFWFKLGDVYFPSDSDSDRRAKVLSRTLKTSSPTVGALGNLGRLLDAGARKITVAEFRQDLTQHTIVGPMPGGTGEVEYMYMSDGSIRGRGRLGFGAIWPSTVSGEWTIVDGERVCTTMQIRGDPGAPGALPQRCEFWFKLGDDYYAADSDSDRATKLVKWTLK